MDRRHGNGMEYKSGPWGNRYVCNVVYLWCCGLDEAAWVLSAGPDGAINTSVDQNIVNPTVGGDDIVRRIK